MKLGSSVAWILVAAAGAVGVVGFVTSGRSGGEHPSGAARTVAGSDESLPGVAVVGLMVNGETRAASQLGQGNELAFFGTFAHTRVALELVYPTGGLIDLRNEGSELRSFHDDAGTDLRGEDSFGGPFEMMPRIAEDGRSLVFVAASEKLPARDASSISVAGTVELLVAHEQRSDASDVLDPGVGKKLTCGPHEFDVSELGKSSWGDGWSITLRSKSDLAPIVSYSWEGEDGEQIELRPSMSMSGMGTWHQTLECDGELPRGSLVVVSWDEPEIVRVPFDVEGRLGLQ